MSLCWVSLSSNQEMLVRETKIFNPANYGHVIIAVKLDSLQPLITDTVAALGYSCNKSSLFHGCFPLPFYGTPCDFPFKCQPKCSHSIPDPLQSTNSGFQTPKLTPQTCTQYGDSYS